MGGDVDDDAVLEFIESGHDVVIAASSQLSEPMRYSSRPIIETKPYPLRTH